MLATAGCNRITPVWAGRDRSGLIQVLLAGGFVTIDSETFVRNTQMWTEADRSIGTVRIGSPKHLAIKALYERLAARVYAAEPMTTEQELELFANYS